MKLGWRESLDRSEVIDLAITALFQAADEDSATGGPDPIRGIYPTVATITGAGFDPVPRDRDLRPVRRPARAHDGPDRRRRRGRRPRGCRRPCSGGDAR